MKGVEVFRNDVWSVELRDRNNHPGKKSWILRDGVEVFSYNGESFRARSHMVKDIKLVPVDVAKAAIDGFFFEEYNRLSNEAIENFTNSNT